MKLIKDKDKNEVYILENIEITYRDTKHGYVISSRADSIEDLLDRFVDIDMKRLQEVEWK